jgi:Fur family ferric uptake transcriptional regulator
VERCNRYDSRIYHYVTVYRCLQKLEEAGLVHSTGFGDGLTRFELAHQTHHHHILCTKCQAIKPLDSCSITHLEKSIKEMGYQNISHRLEFFGVCARCQKPGS